jgi:ABC-2 type transport system permease protein/ribosome-dependent ATPase
VLARKDWRETLRDRVFLLLAFVMPAVLMVAFGDGISHDVRNVPMAVIDHDRTPASRAYVDRYAQSEYFRVDALLESERDARARLSADGARVLLVIPPGFHEALSAGRRAQAQVFVDGSYTTTRFPRAIEGYVTAINAAASAELRAASLARRAGLAPERAESLLRPLVLEVRYLYNAELESRWSVSPSLIVFVIVFVAPLLIALGVVREKESGTMLNVYASTLRRSEFLVGKVLPNLGISAANTSWPRCTSVRRSEAA